MRNSFAITLAALSLTGAMVCPTRHAGAAEVEECTVLADGPIAVTQQLTSFQVVFGKDAISWNEEDYRRLINLARFCDGAKLKTGDVSADVWVTSIHAAREMVLPIALMASEVAAFANSRRLEQAVLPDCRKILSFSIDDDAGSDTSKAVFGVDFIEMSDADAMSVGEYLGVCRQLLKEWSAVSLYVEGLPSQTIDGQLQSVTSRLAFVREARRMWLLKRKEGNIEVVRDGMAIPSTLASDSTRELVGFYDEWRDRFRTDRVLIQKVVNMAEKIRQEPHREIDGLFVDAVMERLNEGIFRR
jgi:hypothetical protein